MANPSVCSKRPLSGASLAHLLHSELVLGAIDLQNDTIQIDQRVSSSHNTGTTVAARWLMQLLTLNVDFRPYLLSTKQTKPKPQNTTPT